MLKMYQNITHITIPDSIQLTNNGVNAFRNMKMLQTIDCNHKSITNMSNMFRDDYNLTFPICPLNVTDMSNAYRYCSNLKEAICGDKVVNMTNAYYRCDSITDAVIGPNVIDATDAYFFCNKLIFHLPVLLLNIH